jgi:hypothetical protein
MGVIRREAHERNVSDVSFPAPWAVNCRLEDSLTNRLRGGSFTGIAAGTKEDPVYRDRALTFSGNAISASRMGNHSDFALSSDLSDTQRAALFQLSEAGEVGGDVVALIPHKDKFLLGFTAAETWVQPGDPQTSGLRNISREVGIIGEDAWCVNHDTVYFLSSAGLYSMGADGGGLKAISEDRIPEDLTGVVDGACVLDYNHADRGVYIHRSSGVSWFYDVERDQFWPFDTGTTDSHLLVGPVRSGAPNALGLIQTIHGVMADGSAAVTWRIIPGETAEDACDDGKAAITAALAGGGFDQYYQASGTWEAGRSKTVHPRVSAPWAVIWLSSSGSWAFESVLLETILFGRHR